MRRPEPVDSRRRCGPRYGATFAALAVIVLAASCRENNASDVSTERIPIPIGESVIDLVVHRSSKPGLAYLNLHDDENTAVEAAIAVIRTHGGIVYELQHGGERNVTFRLRGDSHTVDPNRIFTRRGIDSTLEQYGIANADARNAVKSFADSLLSAVSLRQWDVIVTIHNNTDEGYSARSYAEGGELARDAEHTHLVPDGDPDDFFFVTSHELYETLRDAGANVILQDNVNARDDGSLSILAGREGLPYVNVEAQHGHLEKQRKMLATLHDGIPAGEPAQSFE